MTIHDEFMLTSLCPKADHKPCVIEGQNLRSFRVKVNLKPSWTRSDEIINSFYISSKFFECLRNSCPVILPLDDIKLKLTIPGVLNISNLSETSEVNHDVNLVLLHNVVETDYLLGIRSQLVQQTTKVVVESKSLLR